MAFFYIREASEAIKGGHLDLATNKSPSKSSFNILSIFYPTRNNLAKIQV